MNWHVPCHVLTYMSWVTYFLLLTDYITKLYDKGADKKSRFHLPINETLKHLMGSRLVLIVLNDIMQEFCVPQLAKISKVTSGTFASTLLYLFYS